MRVRTPPATSEASHQTRNSAIAANGPYFSRILDQLRSTFAPYSSYRESVRLCLVVLVGCVGCASPTTPTPPSPPAPSPLPLPSAEARLVFEETLTLTPVSPEAEVYSFGAMARNTGTTCATQISGMVHFRDFRNVIGLSRGFTLDPAIVIAPDQRQPWSGCCVSYDQLQGITNYVVDFSFTSVPCRG